MANFVFVNCLIFIWLNTLLEILRYNHHGFMDILNKRGIILLLSIVYVFYYILK